MEELISFLITAFNLFIICFIAGYFFSDMISKMLAKRKASIAENIESAKLGKEDAKKLHAMYASKIADFSSEKEAILERARRKAEKRQNEMLEDAKGEARLIVSRAMKEADLAKAKVRDDVKRDMIIYASATAKKLIAENMNEEKQAQLIDETLNEMGETTWQN